MFKTNDLSVNKRLKTNDQFDHGSIDDTEDGANMDISDLQSGLLDEFLEPFKTQEDSPNIAAPSTSPFDSDEHGPSEYSVPWNNKNGSQSTTILTVGDQSISEPLQIVEQPFQSSKLRYRAYYIREKGRLGALANKNERSKMKGPVIRIPSCYLDSIDEYFIRVSLVTIKYNETGLHYFHPYEFEHPRNESFNDRKNNSVWLPINVDDSIKSFPLLRIVKKKAFSIQKLDHLRVFDCHDEILHNICASQHLMKKEIDIIKEYNLEKSQLVFTLGKKVINNGQTTMLLYTNATVFSEEMNEYDEKLSDNDTDKDLLNEKTTITDQNIYKYAPKSGFVGNNGEMLIFLKKKLVSKKYGGTDLQITFEYETSEGNWSQSITDFDIKDQMISFNTPIFPYAITNPTIVDIILRQDNRIFGVLKYSYIPSRQ